MKEALSETEAHQGTERDGTLVLLGWGEFACVVERIKESMSLHNMGFKQEGKLGHPMAFKNLFSTNTHRAHFEENTAEGRHQVGGKGRGRGEERQGHVISWNIFRFTEKLQG